MKPSVGEVVWTTGFDSTADKPADVVTQYAADAPRIVAATQATAFPEGSQVEATWTYNDTPLEPFTTQLSTNGITDGQWLSFYLSRDPSTPWPAGLYEIAITLDGAPLRESSVEVVVAE